MTGWHREFEKGNILENTQLHTKKKMGR